MIEKFYYFTFYFEFMILFWIHLIDRIDIMLHNVVPFSLVSLNSIMHALDMSVKIILPSCLKPAMSTEMLLTILMLDLGMGQ